MVEHSHAIRQLKALGLKFRVVGRTEVRVLAKILKPGERIRHCAYGYYQVGSALLVATEERLLLIDKSPFSLNLEGLKYEVIDDVNFSRRILDASVSFSMNGRKLEFRSFKDARLRRLCSYVNDRVTHMTPHLEHTMGDKRSFDSEGELYPLLPRSKVGKFSNYPSS